MFTLVGLTHRVKSYPVFIRVIPFVTCAHGNWGRNLHSLALCLMDLYAAAGQYFKATNVWRQYFIYALHSGFISCFTYELVTKSRKYIQDDLKQCQHILEVLNIFKQSYFGNSASYSPYSKSTSMSVYTYRCMCACVHVCVYVYEKDQILLLVVLQFQMSFGIQIQMTKTK
jgi:hypothetical protein